MDVSDCDKIEEYNQKIEDNNKILRSYTKRKVRCVVCPNCDGDGNTKDYTGDQEECILCLGNKVLLEITETTLKSK